jgi:hypothetical protein
MELFIFEGKRHPSCWKRIAVDLSMLQLLSNNVIINSVDLNGITNINRNVKVLLILIT